MPFKPFANASVRLKVWDSPRSNVFMCALICLGDILNIFSDLKFLNWKRELQMYFVSFKQNNA